MSSLLYDMTNKRDKLIAKLYQETYYMLLAHVKRTMTRHSPEDVVSEMFMSMFKYKTLDAMRAYFYKDSGKPNFGRLKRYCYQVFTTLERTGFETINVDQLYGWEESRDYFNRLIVDIPDYIGDDLLRMTNLFSRGYALRDIDYDKNDVRRLKKYLKRKKKKRGRKSSLNQTSIIKLRKDGLTYRQIAIMFGVSHVTVYNTMTKNV